MSPRKCAPGLSRSMETSGAGLLECRLANLRYFRYCKRFSRVVILSVLNAYCESPLKRMIESLTARTCKFDPFLHAKSLLLFLRHNPTAFGTAGVSSAAATKCFSGFLRLI